MVPVKSYAKDLARMWDGFISCTLRTTFTTVKFKLATKFSPTHATKNLTTKIVRVLQFFCLSAVSNKSLLDISPHADLHKVFAFVNE